MQEALTPATRTTRVLLTFDDGPHPVHTPAVLDRLAAFNLTAAFFLVGKRIADPALVQRIVDEGHLLGNHTYSHAQHRWGTFTDPRADVDRCQELVPEATLFRPPQGRLTPGLWRAAHRRGLRCMTWTLDSSDWRCRSEQDALRCAEQVARAIQPGDVVLFHDDHRWIGSILDVVLPRLEQLRKQECGSTAGPHPNRSRTFQGGVFSNSQPTSK